MKRIHRHLQPLLACALAGVSLPLAVSGAPSSSSGTSTEAEYMLELSAGFRALGYSLSDPRGELSEPIGMLRAATRGLAQLSSAEHRGFDYSRHAERAAALVDQIGAFHSEGREDGVRQAYEELRGTCVSCQVPLRSDNTRRSDYPLAGNIVSGKVKLRDVDGHELEDASWVRVFLERIGEGPARKSYHGPAILSRKGRQLEPRVLPVVAGTTVQFPNDDTIFHNVFSLSKVAPFDLGSYQPGQSRSVVMSRPGLVKVYCNIHPDMMASVVVLRDPWYSLTNAAGEFVLPNVPDGRYALRSWNDRGAQSRIEVEVRGSQWKQAVLSMQNEKRTLRHKNKFGREYGDKYR
ncbi:MAG: hypothetical protein GY711_00930 [bacterium]|nr:hypothetical protein [bacterium]